MKMDMTINVGNLITLSLLILGCIVGFVRADDKINYEILKNDTRYMVSNSELRELKEVLKGVVEIQHITTTNIKLQQQLIESSRKNK